MASPRRDEDGNIISYPELGADGVPKGAGKRDTRPVSGRRPPPPEASGEGGRKPSPRSAYGINNVNTLKGGNVKIGDVGSNNITDLSNDSRGEAKERVKKYKEKKEKEKKEDDVDTNVTQPEYEQAREKDFPKEPLDSSVPQMGDNRQPTGTGEYVEKPPSFVGDGKQSRDGVISSDANREARQEKRLANREARQAEREQLRTERRSERQAGRDLKRQQNELATFDPRAVFTEHRSQFDDPRRRNQPTGPISSSYNGGYSFR